MRPGGIQDDGSDHEHQTVDKRYRSQWKRLEHPPNCHPRRRYSQTYGARQLRLWRHRRRGGVPPRPRSETKAAVFSRLYRCGSLSIARRRQLGTLEFEIYKHTTLMTKDLRTAAHSQLINPAFIKKLAAVKDNLEVVAAKIIRTRRRIRNTAQSSI